MSLVSFRGEHRSLCKIRLKLSLSERTIRGNKKKRSADIKDRKRTENYSKHSFLFEFKREQKPIYSQWQQGFYIDKLYDQQLEKIVITLGLLTFIRALLMIL